MLNVALTGNIASGKTAVGKLFSDWGSTLLDADAIVHELQRPGTPVFRAITAHFGPAVVAPDGSLDRAALRSRILADPAERQALEQIVHPAVQAERRRLLESAKPSPSAIVVSDIPLLFEAADPDAFDAVVLVDAPEALRRERLQRERGLTLAEADALLTLQQPVGPKRARAHFIIDNDGTRDTLRQRTWAVWRKLISLARQRA